MLQQGMRQQAGWLEGRGLQQGWGVQQWRLGVERGWAWGVQTGV